MTTNKLQLPQVTLICLTGLYYKPEEHKKAIDKCLEQIEFGSVKLVMDKKIDNVDDWNKAVIYDLPKYVFTSHALFIHGDSEIINPRLWKDEWLKYDFAGSPWPLPIDNYSYRTPKGRLIRVGNGVGLRSKKLMDLVDTRQLEYHYFFKK